jgi:hypothetical protein
LTDGNPIRVPPSDSLNQLTKQITVAARVFPRQLPTNEFVAVVQRQWREEIHPDLFFLGYGPRDGVLHYKWHLGLVGAEVDLFGLPVGQRAPVVNQWVHLAGTYDSSTGKAALYVNGELIGTETSGGEIRIDPESLERPLVIGAEINGSNIEEVASQFNGYIDEVRIYDRALSDQEIKALASVSSAQPPQADSAALIHTDDLPIQGGPGGDHFRDDCSQDYYAVGFYLRSGAWVDAIGLKCSRFKPDLGMFDTLSSDNSYHGGTGGAFGVEGTCPRRSYLSGITQSFTIDENESQFLKSLEMTCTKMADGSSVKICLETGLGCSDEQVPGASAQEALLSRPIEQHCPKGEAVAGIRGRSGQFVDALGLICKPISSQAQLGF